MIPPLQTDCCKNVRIRLSNSALIDSGTVALPRGVTSAIRSSTDIFSVPLVLIISARSGPYQLAACAARGARKLAAQLTFAERFELIAPTTLDQLGPQ